MVQTSTGRKVGEGAIVSSMTEVVRQGGASGGDAGDVRSSAGGVSAMQGAPSQVSSSSVATAPTAGGAPTAHSSEQVHGATQRAGQSVPVDAGRQAGSKLTN